MGALEAYQEAELRLLAEGNLDDAVLARLQQARVWLAAGETDTAEALYGMCASASRRAARTETVIEVLSSQIRVLRELKRHPAASEAIEEIKRLGREQGDNPAIHSAMLQQAALFDEQGRSDDALATCAELLESCGSSGDTTNRIAALALRARLCDKADQPEHALTAWVERESLAREQGDDVLSYESRAARAELLDRLGRDDEAASVGSEVVNKYQEFVKNSDFSSISVYAPVLGKAWPEVGLAMAQLHIQRADKYTAGGEHNAASIDYEVATLLAPEDPQAINSLAWFLATCPDDGSRNGRHAVELAKKACELSEWNSWSILDTYAAALAETGQFTQALEMADNAIASAPDVNAREKVSKSKESFLTGHPSGNS